MNRLTASEGLLAGMWCLPLLERRGQRAGASQAAIAATTGVKVGPVERLAEPVKHVFTHRVWMLWPCRSEAVTVDEQKDMSKKTCDSQPARPRLWIAPGERPLGGIPRVTEKLLGRLGY